MANNDDKSTSELLSEMLDGLNTVKTDLAKVTNDLAEVTSGLAKVTSGLADVNRDVNNVYSLAMAIQRKVDTQEKDFAATYVKRSEFARLGEGQTPS
ncbi:MAG: hypothetical protein OXG05_01895 [Gammaproteobacteria bacterium]|nr:hypothetical protein [Gammaproteobacteria bacterium]